MRHLLRLVAIFGLALAMTSCYSSYEEDIIPWAYRSVYGQKYNDAFCKSHTEIVDHGIDNSNIGSVYSDLENYEKALEFYERAARKGRTPLTGEEIEIKASKSPRFKAGKALKDKVNG